MARWSRTTRTQTTLPDDAIRRADTAALAYDINLEAGILIGYWDEAELEAEKEKRAAFLAGARSGGQRQRREA